ncbi:MAG: alkaline phosphatase family protein, partial [Candidatus Levyibacteriota bacterium]
MVSLRVSRLKVFLLVLIGLLVIGVILDYFTTQAHVKTEIENEVMAALTQNSSTHIPKFEHIVLIVMENRSYEEIVGNKNAPYVNKLIGQGGLATNYYAITHPSLPNYVALLGGSTFGIKKDCMSCFIKKTNLIDQLEKAHVTWKAYFESLPRSCFLGSVYPYTRKYNSFVYFTD